MSCLAWSWVLRHGDVVIEVNDDRIDDRADRNWDRSCRDTDYLNNSSQITSCFWSILIVLRVSVTELVLFREHRDVISEQGILSTIEDILCHNCYSW